MNNESALDISMKQLEQALSQFDKALQQPRENELAVDGSIQRFEFCCELLWKTLKKYLLSAEGIEVKSPKQTLQAAYKLGLITDEKFWLNLLDDRNINSHTYKQHLAIKIYQRLPEYYTAIKELYEKISP